MTTPYIHGIVDTSAHPKCQRAGCGRYIADDKKHGTRWCSASCAAQKHRPVKVSPPVELPGPRYCRHSRCGRLIDEDKRRDAKYCSHKCNVDQGYLDRLAKKRRTVVD